MINNLMQFSIYRKRKYIDISLIIMDMPDRLKTLLKVRKNISTTLLNLRHDMHAIKAAIQVVFMNICILICLHSYNFLDTSLYII